MIRKLSIALGIFSIALLSIGCASSSGPALADTPATTGEAETTRESFTYNRFNIHVVDSVDRSGKTTPKASYLNCVAPASGHWMVPVNTKITIEPDGRKLVVKTVDTGKTVILEFNSRNMEMSLDEYAKLISTTSLTALDGMSSVDKKGIAEGKAAPGMTKDGVKIALGYPAKHRTPSLDAKKWVYWRDRYRPMVVEFGADGKVKAVH